MSQILWEDDKSIGILETEEEFLANLRQGLAQAGFTYREIEEQARTRDFESFDAQMAWFFVNGYECLSEPEPRN